VEQSGGNIWVYSEPGRGTTFKVYVPVASAEDAGEVGCGPRAVGPRAAASTVLLAEDDSALRLLATEVLEDAGYAVLQAGSTDEARAILSGREIDLILTDMVMPGGTGRELVGLPDARGVQPTILFMSGFTEQRSRQELQSADARFLEKPFTPAGLVAAAAAALETAR
jgi:DNA-binding response OmpR family regulator